MATSSMSPSLYAAPAGLPDALSDEGPTGIEIILEAEAIEAPDAAGDMGDFDENLAEAMSESEMLSLSSELMDLFDQDVSSRKDWVEMYIKGMEVLGMKYEERTEPWAGACGVYSSILTEAAVRFQAETITETFPAAGPVKTEIVGAIDKLKEEAAERVRQDMNYQLTEVMQEFRPEHEKMLYGLGLSGSAFKKVYYDESKQRQVSIYVPSEDVIIPYGATDSFSAERVTHVMRKTPNEMRRLQVKGFYRNVDLGEARSFQTDIEKRKAEEQGYTITDDDRYQVLEIAVDTLLPGGDAFAGYDSPDDEDALACPYIITIDRGTHKVLAIRRKISGPAHALTVEALLKIVQE